MRRAWLSGLIVTGALLGSAWGQTVEPSTGPVFRVSYDVTRAVRPLKADGTVDYIGAINATFSRAVMARENGALLWLEALGPRALRSNGAREAAVKTLGVTWRTDQQFFVRHLFDASDVVEFDLEYYRALDGVMEVLCDYAWNPVDQPLAAKWLALNEAAMRQIAQAVQRPRWFLPVLEVAGALSLAEAMAASAPSEEWHYNSGRAFLMRANLRRFENRPEEVWPDIETAYRLGILMMQGARLEERMAGVRVIRRAQRTIQQIAIQHVFDDTRYRRWLDLVGSLPLPPAVSPIVDQSARFAMLDLAMRWSADPKPMLMRLAEDEAQFGPLQRATLLGVVRTRINQGRVRNVDWLAVLRRLNAHYDQVEKSMAGRSFPERARAAHKTLASRAEAVREIVQLTDDGSITRWVGAVLIAAGHEKLERAQIEADLARASHELTAASIGLALYRINTGWYPERLELVRPYARGLPMDFCSGRPAMYRLTADGFVLYSVGPNLRDDRGRDPTQGEEFAGTDDVVVRLGTAD